MKNQILTSHVTAWCIFVVISTNYNVDLTISKFGGGVIMYKTVIWKHPIVIIK